MKHFKMDYEGTTRYDENGNGESGKLLVGEDKIVRWFSEYELDGMQALGPYQGHGAISAYDDGQPQ